MARPSYVAKTIHFEDHAQDFLEWDLSSDDMVVDCRPFQRSVWVGCKVVNADVEVGERVHYLAPGSGRVHVIAYPVEAID